MQQQACDTNDDTGEASDLGSSFDQVCIVVRWGKTMQGHSGGDLMFALMSIGLTHPRA